LYSPGTLLAGADVGARPDRPAVSVEEFHERMRLRAEASPLGLNTLSTHDSKRSHDVRCRLSALSELPERWEAAVTAIEERQAASHPDPADRRYLYESLVGGWPVDGRPDDEFVRRVQEHVVKAAREAKRLTSWLRPDEKYESSLQTFAAAVVEDPSSRSTLESIVAAIGPAGATNSLSSVLLRATTPGVPDVYQSDDRWLLAYVDPDNRRPLDLDRHRESLAAAERASIGDLLAGWQDGRIKQAVIRATLRLRRDQPGLFHESRYLPLTATGAAAKHVVAFARVTDAAKVLVVVPRLSHGLAGDGRFPVGDEVWGDTALQLLSLAGGGFLDMLTGREISAAAPLVGVGEVLSQLPVALLVSR
jgi:(1->4)-alpha-D-glucan 1-alpha-D-glucosylmutase